MKIDLPSGAWADLLTPDKLKAKHHRTAIRAVSNVENTRQGGMAVDMLDGALAIVVQDWDVPGEDGQILPIPSVDFDSIGEMEVEDYEALLAHPFVTQIVKRLQELRGEKVTPDDHDDPSSPSEPSNGSGPGPRAKTSLKAGTSAPSGTTKRSTSGSRTGGAGRQSK